MYSKVEDNDFFKNKFNETILNKSSFKNELLMNVRKYLTCTCIRIEANTVFQCE